MFQILSPKQNVYKRDWSLGKTESKTIQVADPEASDRDQAVQVADSEASGGDGADQEVGQVEGGKIVQKAANIVSQWPGKWPATVCWAWTSRLCWTWT